MSPEVHNAHAMLVQLVENSPFGVYIVDGAFRLMHVSGGARKVFENIRPLLGRDFSEILRILCPEPFASETIRLFRHTLDTGESYRAPATLERREDIGEVESYDWKIDRLTLPDGNYGVVCHFYDLSDRQRYDEVLRKSEQRFMAAFHQNPVPMAILNLEGRYLEVNDALVAHAGYNRQELIGHTTDQLEVFAERREHDEYYRQLEIQNSLRSFPAALRTRSGEIRNCMLSAEKIELDSAPCILAVRVDVTDRVQLERARRESEARERARTAELETIMEAVPAALWIAHDAQCLQITGNPESYRLLRMSYAENISANAGDADRRPFREYQGDIPIPPDRLPMQRAAALGKEVREETITLKFSDGEERHIFGNAAPLFEEDGRVRGVVASFLDITRLRRAEAALIHADRRKDQFLAMLAHELRNPLGTMLNAVTLISRSDVAQSPIKKMIEIIHRQVKHMTRLVDDLLDVSRLTQGKITLKKEKVKLSTVIDHAVEMANSIIEKLGHRLVVSLPSELIFVHVDAPRLAQAISNLLSNSAKYTPQGGEIRLSGEYQNDEITIRVRDNGIGIVADDLPEVFHLFSQADRSLDRSQGGLGIGLALVKNLVELHGGRVIAKSDGLGQGSEFILHIPTAAETDPIDAVRHEEEQAAHSRQRILVVDDNEDSANSLAKLLEFEGHNVEIAYGARRALDCAEVFQPDVVVLDIGLPEMDGYEVAAVLRAKKETQAATLIALTGYGQEKDRERAKQAGFDHHFVKPLDTAKLIGILTPKNFVDGRQLALQRVG